MAEDAIADMPGPDGCNDAGLIDARGLLCPLPVLRLRKALLALAPGDHLRLIATDPAAVIDIPHFCAQSGHVLISVRELPDVAREFTVRKGASAPQA